MPESKPRTVDVRSMLSRLIELELDALMAYSMAVVRLDDRASKAQMREFIRDHERHADKLVSALTGIGGERPPSPGFEQILTKGKVVIASLIGDRGVLMAMRSNEDATNRAYRRAAATPNMPAELPGMLLEQLDDERRHAAWFEAKLVRMGEGTEQSDQLKPEPSARSIDGDPERHGFRGPRRS